jgi:hypothetical protein
MAFIARTESSPHLGIGPVYRKFSNNKNLDFAMKIISFLGICFFVESNIALSYASLSPIIYPLGAAGLISSLAMMLLGVAYFSVKQILHGPRKKHMKVQESSELKAEKKEIKAKEIRRYENVFLQLLGKDTKESPYEVLYRLIEQGSVQVTKMKGTQKRQDRFEGLKINKDGYCGFFPNDAFFIEFAEKIVSYKRNLQEAAAVYFERKKEKDAKEKDVILSAKFNFSIDRSKINKKSMQILLKFISLASILAFLKSNSLLKNLSNQKHSEVDGLDMFLTRQMWKKRCTFTCTMMISGHSI